MKNVSNLFVLAFVFLNFSCMGEAKEKLKQAKSTISNTSTLVKEARKAESKMDKLKEADPLTNEQLKSWLPEKVDGMERTGFKTGQAGMYMVNSIEGTYQEKDGGRTVKINVIDGAGPTGSMMAAGFGMFGNLDMEEEDEQKHRKSVDIEGGKAQQTYYKKRNDTQLAFAHGDRFLVTFTGNGMDPEEAWQLVDKFNLEDLTEMTE